MAFKLVFRSLQEVFPQVDLRILKAVAIEHSKDVDAAVEFVLSEVLPSLSDCTLDDTQETEHSFAEVGTQQDISLGHQGVEKRENASPLPGSSVACGSDPCNDHTCYAHLRSQFMEEITKISNVEADQPHLLLSHQETEEVNASLPSELMSMEPEKAAVADHTTDSFHFKSQLFNETVSDTSLSNAWVHDQLVSIAKLVEQVSSVDQIAQPSLESAETGFGTFYANVQEFCKPDASGIVTAVCTSDLNFSSIPEETPSLKGFGAAVEKDMNNYASKSEDQLARGLGKTANVQDFCSLEANNSVSAAITSTQDISSSLLENTPDLIECGPLSEKANNSFSSEHKDQHSRSLTESDYVLALETDIAYVADDYKPTVVTQSGHVIRIDFLEDFITDAKSNKKTLVSALDSVSNMMKEVEFHEERAKQAKEEASEAGLDILTKVEDLKQLLKHEKEANDMHAGEIYGEKAILATEARELQSRLLNLSDERDKSLSIIEEIRSTLKARLAAAEEEQAAAELEKLRKEENARKILMEQELVMDNIVQESKRLQQESEENAKLREFLMDRGRIVDALQGEIAVICEDVMMLKERVDGHVPLHRSISSTASSLVSSSSSSHHRSMLSERILRPVELGDSPKMISGELLRSQELESTANDKASSDDEWEFFDDKLEMLS